MSFRLVGPADPMRALNSRAQSQGVVRLRGNTVWGAYLGPPQKPAFMKWIPDLLSPGPPLPMAHWGSLDPSPGGRQGGHEEEGVGGGLRQQRGDS